MPIYEYHCRACGAEFEAIVPFSAADNVSCERCGGDDVERVASMFACSMDGGGGGAALPACGGGG